MGELTADLIRACHRVGSQIPLWIQGPGGNLSTKDSDTLTIKASGARLGDVTPTYGLALASLKMIQKNWMPTTEAAYSELIRESAIQGRPSMETGFHALLPKKHVAHFHALSALLMAYQYQVNPTRIQEHFKKNSTLSFAWVPPVMPGLLLSDILAKNPQHDIYILANHGVVLQSDVSFISILDAFAEIEKKFLKEFNYNLSPKKESELKTIDLRLYFPDSAVLLDKIDAITNKSAPNESGAANSFRELKPHAKILNLDAFELLWGTDTLTRAEPSLSELPLEISQKVATLPTELIRKTTIQ